MSSSFVAFRREILPVYKALCSSNPTPRGGVKDNRTILGHVLLKTPHWIFEASSRIVANKDLSVYSFKFWKDGNVMNDLCQRIDM